MLLAATAGVRRGTLTRFGVNIPTNGWGDLFAFETDTGVTTRCVRVFGGVGNSTTHAARAATARTGTTGGLQPGCDIYLSCRFAENPATSDATLISYLQTVQAIAEDTVAAGAEFFLSMNPEPDRTDRTYTSSEFLTMHTRWAGFCTTHAPDVTRIFNVTGFDFLGRIGTWEPDPSEYEMLAVDTYWLQSESHQASVDDTIDAHGWLAANRPGKRFGMGEWGVQVGVDQDDDLLVAVPFIAGFNNPAMEIAPYFEDVGAWDTRLTGSGNEALYGQAVNGVS